LADGNNEIETGKASCLQEARRSRRLAAASRRANGSSLHEESFALFTNSGLQLREGTLTVAINVPRFWALLIVGILVTPIVAAIWSHPWFVTQDGPIYLYNSHIILESLKSNNPFREYYWVRPVPVPYWGAYLFLTALMSVVPERIADHLMVTITSVGLMTCILWLSWKVAGWDGMALVAPFAVILSLNILWLSGLYNFIFGAGCYLITLGVWWSSRDDLGLKRALQMAVLLIANFLCHPVSLGVTVFALIALSAATPGAEWRRRAGWTLVSIVPLVPLIFLYRSMMQAAAAIHPRWMNLADPLSARQWLTYSRRVNILSLIDQEPNLLFSHTVSSWSHLPAVTTWTIVGLILLSLSSVIGRQNERSAAGNTTRGWVLVSAALILCGLFGPDDVGEAHGGFLRERILLLGLATVVPILKPRLTRARPGSLVAAVGFGALLIAAYLQLAAVRSYAQTSNRLAGEFMQAKPYVGTGQRVAVLIVEPETNYEPKPLLHLPELFGIDSGNVIWNNYGPGLYYFPVRFRDASNASLFYVRGIPEFTDHQISQEDLEDWADLLSEIEARTDVLVVWRGTAELDEVNSEWFADEPVFQNDNVRVFRHRQKGIQ
jgi:hypothetical protein